jgi:Protein of unknown function (DUF4232)
MKPLLIGAVAVIGLITCACSSSPTAAIPVKTTTITARPSATHPPATPTPSSPTSSPVAAACQTKHLDGSVGGSPIGTPSGLELVIVFRNLRTGPCTLSGWPSVAQAAGTPVADIGQPSTADTSTPRTVVTLPPGGFASARLKVAYAANQLAVACKPVKATWLRVIPPGQRTPLNISFGTTACQGKAKLMSVTSVVQGSAG